MTVADQMWIEKYRPETLSEVLGQDAAVDRFGRWLDNPAEMPHVLMSGPAGVGKTATSTAFGRDLYGDHFDANFQEMNASDERGIDDVRDTIKQWCRKAPAGDYQFKIVFLDEADQLTSDAQPALRRIMEQFNDTTRFILSCNYKTEIIGPLQSRCAPFHFGRLDDDAVEGLVSTVANAEAIDVEDAALAKVVRSARGQARNAVMTLQQSALDGELQEEQVDLFTGIVDDGLTEEILQLAFDGEIDDAQRRLDVEILKAGADPHMLLDSVFRSLRRLDLPADYRAKCFELLGTIEERLQAGLNPHVQFHALLAHLYMSQGLSPMAQQEDA